MKRMLAAFFVLVASTAPMAAPEPKDAPPSFTGDWKTSFGPMKLTQNGDKVEGHYEMNGERCTITGKLEKGRLNFTYAEAKTTGEGWFELAKDGQSFAGKWTETGGRDGGEWKGTRADAVPVNFHGVWQTSFGRMRLVQTGNKVEGIYAYGGGATLTGAADKGKLTFTYRDDADGEGFFELSEDGQSFTGKWKSKGGKDFAPWKGTRVEPKPGMKWLVIIEANWEADLTSQEYAFGDMLRAFFKRDAKIQVRQRSFRDADGLKRWCQEVAYLAEPVVLVLATHGSEKGVTVEKQVVDGKTIGQSLKYASNIQLLHFSACCIMKENVGQDIQKALDAGAKFPISGYTTVVDWAGSAIIEFTYLDMILIRNKSIPTAAEQVKKLLTFSGDEGVAGSVIPPAGFRLLMPK